MKSLRGAILVESALVLPVILFLVYGSIQLGMVGLEQLTVDGGAYASAHQTALLGSNLANYISGPAVAKAALPHLGAATTTLPNPTLGPPPATQFSDTYNLTDSNARHGGVSMVEPVQTVGFATSANFASLLLGTVNNISVTGVAIDPAFRLINGHGDVSGNAFNSNGAFLTASDPLVDGTNAPPYFVGFNYMEQCPYALLAANAAPWTTCPKSKIVGLGMAEYLDADNWGRATNGVVPTGSAVFADALLHQDEFAKIATDLAAAPFTANRAGLSKAAVADPLGRNPAYLQTACVYSFDVDNLGSYAVGTVTIGTYPLNPRGNAALCGQ